MRKTYTVYKDSGFEWLQDVPNNWELRRIKRICRNVSNQIDKAPKNVPYIALEHIKSWTSELDFSSQSEPESSVKRFMSGDVLFGRLRPYLAKAILASEDGVCVGELLVLRPKNSEINSRFLLFYLLTKNMIDVINSSTYGAKMPRASWDFIGSLPVFIPPLEEQQAIVRYLDHKLAQINKFITNKQKLIKLLEEEKAVTITNSVTKGINKRASMKHSGVEWLGDIPKTWDVKRTKHLFRLITKPAPNNNNMELLSVYTDIGVKPRKELEERGNRASTTDGYWIVKKGDFIKPSA